MYRIVAILFLGVMVMSCVKKDTVKDDGDTLLAEVGNRKLYFSEIANLMSKGNSPTDSMRVLNGIANSWITNQLMILEAERNMPKDLKLNELVDNYRSSLLLYNYENKLINEYLDTVVTDVQKQDYYAEHKDEFKLSEAIAKYMVAKIPTNSNSTEDFKRLWKSNDIIALDKFCNKQSNFFESNDTEWRTLAELLSILPDELFNSNNLDKKGDFHKSDKRFEYYVKIMDYAGKNQIPPFDYIDPKITKVLLNQRKEQLLKNKRQQIFDKEGRGNRVKHYVQ